MKQLDKTQQEQQSTITQTLRNAHTALDAAVSSYNERIEDHADVDSALNAYNAALSDARELRDQIASDITEYVDARSDKWREGDRGQAYESWKSAWDDISLEDIDLEVPAAIEIPEDGDIEAFADAPTTPD